MKFAILDGDRKASEKLISIIEDYAVERKIGIDYQLLDTDTELEEQVDDFDLFFLEHCLPKFDGLEVARKIREVAGNKKAIIFVATDKNAVFEAFTVNAHRYFVKPVEKEKIFEALDAYIQQNGVNGCLVIKSGRRADAIKLSDIYYIEILRKDMYIHCKEKTYKTRQTMASVEKGLEDKNFFRVHRSYLVNMNNVKKYDDLQIEFLNGQKISISMRKYMDFDKAMNNK